jgi:hypothetical protein
MPLPRLSPGLQAATGEEQVEKKSKDQVAFAL